MQKFTDIYNDLYPILFSIAYNKVNNFDEAKDICQDVFFIFYQKLDEVKEPRKWLMGTLKNTICTFYKRKGKDNIDINDFMNDKKLSFTNGQRDMRVILKQALDDDVNFVDDKDRNILELIAFYGLTYREVARHLHITKRMVRYRYEIIIKRIFQYLKDRGIKSLEDLL